MFVVYCAQRSDGPVLAGRQNFESRVLYSNEHTEPAERDESHIQCGWHETTAVYERDEQLSYSHSSVSFAAINLG